MKRALATAAVLCVLAAACGSGAAADVVVVSAAASLTDAFTEMAAAFEAAHPDVEIALNFAGSSALREQIVAGAPVDVLATANELTMRQASDAGVLAAEPEVFAVNELAIVVPRSNEAGVVGLRDFADPQLFVGLCAESVPCGVLAREVLAAAGVRPSIDSSEPDVRSLLTKVAAGELDVGLVYLTDIAVRADEVAGIDLPAELDAASRYPIALVADSPNPDLGQAFIDFVATDAGREIMLSHGFGPP